ncbi:MAG TPA: hypothetical protein DD640_01325 [Clostridiales bacterium]|nr:hypothetical protein [Clostridiales bacterium]
MADIYGNLALKRRRSAAVRQTAGVREANQTIQLRPDKLQTKRIPVSATPAPEQASLARARSIRRALARQRLKLISSIVLTIFLVTGIFAAVVYRQAMILEMNFRNLSVERAIAEIEKENSQISESLAQQTNLDEIRHLAFEKLGLQDPARMQIVTVPIPNTDRVVFAGDTGAAANDEAYLAGVMNNIEGYFKTLSQQRQGD